MGAMLIPRHGSGASFPLAALLLFIKLGYGSGCSRFGFIALTFVAIPLLFIVFGMNLRGFGLHGIIE